ncbi:MAG: GNAT family N-acetyltransferase [Deltaproteobacteria bacterium]|nr:GNAT family N-acetyltransferase [Deltaproteobacteria bacterium]
MSERWRAGSSARWESIVGYSRVVRVGPQVTVTGTIALDDDGNPVKGGAAMQTRRVMLLLERALRRVGATPEDVVRTRIFVTDIANDWEAIGRAHGEVFGAIRPATTMVEVSALIEPWARVEIEVDALIGGSPVREAPAVSIHRADPAALWPLLEAAGLPPADPEGLVWVAKDMEGAIIGGVSLVWIAGDVLVRSVVVADAHRRSGVGALLVDAALVRARGDGAAHAYLVTENAEGFFATLGFGRMGALPEPVRARLPEMCRSATSMSRSM